MIPLIVRRKPKHGGVETMQIAYLTRAISRRASAACLSPAAPHPPRVARGCRPPASISDLDDKFELDPRERASGEPKRLNNIRSHVLVERLAVVRHEEQLNSVHESRVGDFDLGHIRRVGL